MQIELLTLIIISGYLVTVWLVLFLVSNILITSECMPSRDVGVVTTFTCVASGSQSGCWRVSHRVEITSFKNQKQNLFQSHDCNTKQYFGRCLDDAMSSKYWASVTQRRQCLQPKPFAIVCPKQSPSMGCTQGKHLANHTCIQTTHTQSIISVSERGEAGRDRDRKEKDRRTETDVPTYC